MRRRRRQDRAAPGSVGHGSFRPYQSPAPLTTRRIPAIPNTMDGRSLHGKPNSSALAVLPERLFEAAIRLRDSQPSAAVPCTAQSVDDPATAARELPDEATPMILNHQHDRSQVQSEMVRRDPAAGRTR